MYKYYLTTVISDFRSGVMRLLEWSVVPRSRMSRTYTASAPWRLHGVAEQLYVTLTESECDMLGTPRQNLLDLMHIRMRVPMGLKVGKTITTERIDQGRHCKCHLNSLDATGRRNQRGCTYSLTTLTTYHFSVLRKKPQETNYQIAREDHI
jgi:hypothetical protein